MSDVQIFAWRLASQTSYLCGSLSLSSKCQDSTLNEAMATAFHIVFSYYSLIILSFDALQSELLTASLDYK
jgi:hypothetical protein